VVWQATGHGHAREMTPETIGVSYPTAEVEDADGTHMRAVLYVD